MIGPIPDNERERLKCLREHSILDTASEEMYDDIVLLAAQICEVPISAISLIDKDRQWFKAIIGLEVQQTDRSVAFCAHTIVEPDILVVPDASIDHRFVDNPLVTGEPGIRFYAGVPLVSPDGYSLGSLCVIDKVPRQLTDTQLNALRALGRQARAQLELSRKSRIREQLLAERDAALGESRRLAAIVESSGDAIMCANLDGAFTYWNGGAERLYGFTAAEMIGRSTSSIANAGESSSVAAAVDAFASGENIYSCEVTRIRKDGIRVDLSLSFSPIRDLDGRTTGVSCIGRDIGSSKALERQLRENTNRLQLSEASLRAVLDSAPIILYAVDTDGTVTLSEGTGLAALGLKPGQAVGTSVFDFSTDPLSLENTRRALAGESVSYDVSYQDLTLHTELRPVQGEDGILTGFMGICFDLTQWARSEERFRVLFEHSTDAHMIFDSSGILDCNPATISLLRCLDISQVKSIHPALLSPEFQPDGRRSDEKCLEMDAIAYRDGFNRFEWVHRTMDGEDIPVEVTLTPVKLSDSDAMLVVWHDLRDRKRVEQQTKDYSIVLEFQKQELEKSNAELEIANTSLANLATTDALTGLKNHRALQESLDEQVSIATRYTTPLSLVILDVDYFKRCNDTYGHPEGDAVLRNIASILEDCARESDVVARYGGEEFVVILPQTGSEGARVIAERLRASIESFPWRVDPITASIGVSFLGISDDTAADLLARADAALYTSKAEGRNRVTCGTSPD